MPSSPKRKIRFIVNPVSGVGRQRNIQELLYRCLNHEIYDYEVIFTQYPGHATELAQEAVIFGYYAVIAVGGDGSVHEVARGLLHSDTFLGIIPCGSGNGLARHLKIPLNNEKAIERINRGETDLLDIGVINNRCFVNIAGLGFDGHVAHCFSKHGKRGFKTYVKVVMKEIFRYPGTEAWFEWENQKFKAGSFLNSVCIGSQFGNNAYIAPQASHNDGYFEVVIIDKILSFKLLFLLFYLFTRKTHLSGLVKTYRVNSLRITGDLSRMHLDGEPFSIPEGHAHVTLLNKAIRVII